MERIPPSRKLRQEVEALLEGWDGGGHPLDALVRLGARYMLQVALEEEVEEFLGRAHYQRGQRRRQGWRNGYEPGKVKTAEGLLEVALPQLRAAEEPFHSYLAQAFREGSDILGRLVTEMYVRGLSARDVEGIFTLPGSRRILMPGGSETSLSSR